MLLGFVSYGIYDHSHRDPDAHSVYVKDENAAYDAAFDTRVRAGETEEHGKRMANNTYGSAVRDAQRVRDEAVAKTCCSGRKTSRSALMKFAKPTRSLQIAIAQPPWSAVPL